MIRILFFVALGGTITLSILAAAGADIFFPWSIGFLTATVILLGIWIPATLMVRTARRRRDSELARTSHRLRSALILSRHQTGLFINEQPEVRFDLLVDRPRSEGLPFRTTAKRIVSLLDLHEVARGKTIAVAHPESEYGRVHIADAPAPQPFQRLDAAAAEQAPTLPEPPRRSRSKAATLVPITAALLLGAVGAPFLATPEVPKYVELIAQNRTEELTYVTHPLLFEPENLQESLTQLATESGHEEVFSVEISDVSLKAEIPPAAGSTDVDLVQMQDHRVTEREPASGPRERPEERSFLLSEVDWAGVLAGVPEAQQLAVDRGLADAQLRSITVKRSPFGLAPVEALLYFASERGSELIRLDVTGDLTGSEKFSMLPEDEQKTYLFAADAWLAVQADLVEQAGTELVSTVTNHGEHASITAHPKGASGSGGQVKVDYHRGRIGAAEPAAGPNASAQERFELSQVKWSTVFKALPAAEQALADAGLPAAQTGYLIVKRHPISGEIVVNVYAENEAGMTGRAVVSMSGKISDVKVN